MKLSDKSYIANILLTSLAPIIWGSTYIVTTEMLHANRPFITAMIRTLPLGVLITLYFWQKSTSQHASNQLSNQMTKKLSNQLGNHTPIKMCILAFLNISLFQAMLFVGAYRLPGSIVAMLGSIQPLVILTLMYAIDEYTPKPSTVVAVLFVIVGMGMLLIQPNELEGILSEWDTVGILASVIGAVSMALGMYLTKKWKQNTYINAIAFTGWQLMFGGLMLFPVALYFEEFPKHFSLLNILGYGYLAIFGSAIAYSLWMRGIAKLPTVTVSLLGAFSPITATVLGWVFLNQTFSILQSFGFIIAMISVVYVQLHMRGGS